MSKTESTLNSKRNMGFILIIIGVLLPLVTLILLISPIQFQQGSTPIAFVYYRYDDTHTLSSQTPDLRKLREPDRLSSATVLLNIKQDVPYRFLLILGLVLSGTGTGLVLLNPIKRTGEEETFSN